MPISINHPRAVSWVYEHPEAHTAFLEILEKEPIEGVLMEGPEAEMFANLFPELDPPVCLIVVMPADADAVEEAEIRAIHPQGAVALVED